MSNKQQKGRLNQGNRSQSELLNELDSLKELLDEENDDTTAVTSVNEIRSVKEYMLFKRKADEVGLDLATYLTQRANGLLPRTTNSDETEIPLLDEVVALEGQRFAANHSESTTPRNESAAISTLAEVDKLTRNIPAKQKFSLEALEQMVASIVEQKLQAIKPQLEKQVFDQIRNRLPLDTFK